MQFLLYFSYLAVSLQRFDNLLSLHEVVAVLPVDHKELIVGFEVISNESFVRMPRE